MRPGFKNGSANLRLLANIEHDISPTLASEFSSLSIDPPTSIKELQKNLTDCKLTKLKKSTDSLHDYVTARVGPHLSGLPVCDCESLNFCECATATAQARTIQG